MSGICGVEPGNIVLVGFLILSNEGFTVFLTSSKSTRVRLPGGALQPLLWRCIVVSMAGVGPSSFIILSGLLLGNSSTPFICKMGPAIVLTRLGCWEGPVKYPCKELSMILWPRGELPLPMPSNPCFLFSSSFSLSLSLPFSLTHTFPLSETVSPFAE